MNGKASSPVALVGCGIIGRGWIPVFAGAGCPTRLYDEAPAQGEKAIKWFESQLQNDVSDGFLSAGEAEACRERVTYCPALEEALEGVDYIQESVPEELAIKRSVFAQIDRAAPERAVIASSSSGMDINDIVVETAGKHRCILAHPVNPPYVVPLVEVLPGRETDPKITEKTIGFLKGLGQKPILMNYYINDFIVNRLQDAVMREAIYLVEEGVADVSAVDAALCDGLGLRWAILGAFGVNNTNADGGIREYYQRFGESYREGMALLATRIPSFDPEMIERIARQVDLMEGEADINDICRWRDRLVRKIRGLKIRDPHP